MKYLKQLAIIFALCILGQLGSILIGGLIPGNVLAMVLLFVLLLTNIIKVRSIEETSDFILANMAFFFVPAIVSVYESYKILLGNVFQLLIIGIITTILTSLSAGFTVKYVLRWQASRRKQK